MYRAIAGLRDWNENTLETLHLVIRHQGRLVPTVGGILLFGTERERYFPDAWIQCGRFGGTDKARILDQLEIRTHLPICPERCLRVRQETCVPFGRVWGITPEGCLECSYG